MLPLSRNLPCARTTHAAIQRSTVAVRPLAPCRAPTVVVHAAAKAKAEKVLKRAPTPFNLYSSTAYAETKAVLTSEGKKAGLVEVNAVLREKWATLPDSVKAPFEKDAARLKEEVAARRAAEPKEATGGKRASSAAAKRARGSTPRPANAYALFTKDNYAGVKAEHPDLKVADVQKIIAVKWKELPEPEKEKYSQRSKAAFAEYKLQEAAVAAAAPPPPAPEPVAQATDSAPVAAVPAARKRTRSASPTKRSKSAAPAAAAAAPAPAAAAPPAPAPAPTNLTAPTPADSAAPPSRRRGNTPRRSTPAAAAK